MTGNDKKQSDLCENRYAHDPSVMRYREITADKCQIEMRAVEMRLTRGVKFGSDEMKKITRTCADRSCAAKYHWCATCWLMPRCSCLEPHMSPFDSKNGRHWFSYQEHHIRRFGELACDDRYGAFANVIKRTASGIDNSHFCKSCACKIQRCPVSTTIGKRYGRTYLELAHYLWGNIRALVCASCVKMLNALPCIHSGFECPSAKLPLICERLTSYTPRHSMPDRPKESADKQLPKEIKQDMPQKDHRHDTQTHARSYLFEDAKPVEFVSAIVVEPIHLTKPQPVTIEDNIPAGIDIFVPKHSRAVEPRETKFTTPRIPSAVAPIRSNISIFKKLANSASIPVVEMPAAQRVRKNSDKENEDIAHWNAFWSDMRAESQTPRKLASKQPNIIIYASQPSYAVTNLYTAR